jgi:TolB-like protein/class 3 adenylate cyclase/Tfp pilus assembly protein PilF
MEEENDPKDVTEISESISAPNLITQIISEARPSSASEHDDESLSEQVHRTPSSGSKSLVTKIAYVLFMDIVDFSKRSTEQQTECIETFQEVVTGAHEFQHAQSRKQLISRSTGDGMALVFFGDYTAPAQCALEVSRALKAHPEIGVRMGVFSGPVVVRKDVSKQKDVTGDGINIAQRVMDFGDAGHILFSKTIADYLRPSDDWNGNLHDLGEVKVKHDVIVHLFNYYDGEVGNPNPTERSLQVRRKQLAKVAAAATLVALVLVAALAFYLFSQRNRPPINSVAILPFVNDNGDPAAQSLSDGLSEDVINILGNLSYLKVTDRNSAAVFKKPEEQADLQSVGNKLNVRAVLTGRFGQHGDKIALHVELVDVQDKRHLWGKNYEWQHSDLPGIPSEIATEVSKNLRLKLTGEEQGRLAKRYSESAVAVDLYYKGRQFLNSRKNEAELNQGIDYFNRAIQEDPNYALAYSGLADAYGLLTFYGNGKGKPAEMNDKSKASALKALELDDQLAEAHASLARNKAFYEWDWAGAEKEFKQAITLKPGYASAHHLYGEFLVSQGRFEEAISELQESVALDQFSTVNGADLGGEAYFYARQYDNAIQELQAVIGKDANKSWYPHYLLGWAYAQTGRLQEAKTELEAVAQDSATGEVRPSARAMLAYVYALAGRKDEARQIIEELDKLSAEKYVSPYYVATIYAGLDEKGKAIEQLRLAKKDRFIGMVWLKVNPRFDNLRNEDGFKELMQELRFPS